MKPYWIRVKGSGCFQMKVVCDTLQCRGDEYRFYVNDEIILTIREEEVVYLICPVKVDDEWVKPDNITYLQEEE